MASARTLSANELGAARYQQALTADLWPVEVRLHRLPHDADSTVYTLHTAAADPVPFRHTARNDLRATLRVSPGALQYEVLRDGTLVSTGGVDVQAPQSPLQRSQMATRLAERPPSGAVQLSLDDTAAHRRAASGALSLSQTTAVTQSSVDGDDTHASESASSTSRRSHSLWPVRFVYEEVTWMAREVDVVDAESGALLAPLKRDDSRFVGVASVPSGTLRFRFRVRPHEGLSAHTAPFTRLGWDDAAMRHTWGLVTWPLEVRVADLAAGKEGPGAALVEVSETAAMAAVEARRKRAQEAAIQELMDDDDDDDDDDDMDDEDEDDELEDRSEEDESGRVDGIVRNMVKTVEAYDLTSPAETPRSKSGMARRFVSTETTKSEEADTPRSTTSTHIPVEKGKAKGGGPHHGVGCMVVGVVMFVLGSGMTIWLGSRGRPGRRDDEWNEVDEEMGGGRPGGTLLRHQQGVSF